MRVVRARCGDFSSTAAEFTNNNFNACFATHRRPGDECAQLARQPETLPETGWMAPPPVLKARGDFVLVQDTQKLWEVGDFQFFNKLEAKSKSSGSGLGRADVEAPHGMPAFAGLGLAASRARLVLALSPPQAGLVRPLQYKGGAQS